ncbi:hypothetical protein FRUB_01815 [Fimbriiglobus ruber]|uniref:Uncharacterized protein n=1 Tax=Fimbriiglobus ruber TaxID=1908690 RepID=A0A225E104_9BACT|nr:hypothetical protein FRUB_01815 [Fimbriiglobus ruber]
MWADGLRVMEKVKAFRRGDGSSGAIEPGRGRGQPGWGGRQGALAGAILDTSPPPCHDRSPGVCHRLLR